MGIVLFFLRWLNASIPAARDLFKAITEHTQLCPIYEEFLHRTFAWENFGFWRAVQSYQEIESQEERLEQSKKIYDEFLEYEAEHECGDIEPQHRQAVKAQLYTGDKDVFEFLSQYAVNCLIASTLQEFLQDDSFKQYEEQTLDDPEESCMPCRMFAPKRKQNPTYERVLFPEGFTRVVPLGYL